MKSIIEDIYLNNHASFDTIKEGEEYWKIHDEVVKLYESLSKELSDEQKEIFTKLYTALDGLESEAAMNHFKEGFKLGLKIGIEAFT